MKKLLIIALCFTLTVHLSAQTQSDGRASVGMQNGSKHFDVAAHLRQLKINEMNSQARMKRVQSKPAALRTASPMHRNPGAVQPEKPVSVQPKAPARKAAPAASAKSRSTANNGGFWKYKEKLDSILENNGNTKRTFEYDYDGIVTNESVYELRNDKTWSLSETNEYNYYDNNVIKSKIHYGSSWDSKPHYRSDEYYDKFGYQSSWIDYNYDNDEFIPSTKCEYYHDQWGNIWELNWYIYQDGEWVLSWESHKEVEYDNEGRLIYICDTQNNSKNEYYYDENGNLYDKARYSYISEEVGFVRTYLVTLDENNRVISEEEYNITDWSTGATELKYKHEYAYDENGNMTADLLERKDRSQKHEHRFVNFYDAENDSYNQYQTVSYNYYWSNDTWVGDGTGYERVYDENGNLTLNEEFVWDNEAKGWKGNYKEEREYDENGNRTLYEVFVWDDETKGWKGSYKEEREYDENGNQTMYKDFVWDDEAKGWKGSYKEEREYDGDGNLTITGYWWDGENGIWYDNPQEMTKYNKDGNVTLYENYTPNESYKYEYVYDEYGNCTKFYYWWDGEHGQWHEHPKTITKYDENGYDILYEDYSWDGDNKVWVASWKYEWYYTPAPSGGYYGNDKARYEVVNGEFVCTYNAEIDDQKRIISEEYFSRDRTLGIYVPNCKYVYVYDDNGESHITDYYSYWDSEMEHYKYLEHTYYNSNYQNVSYKTSEYNGSEYVATSGYDVEFDDHGEVLKATDVTNPDNYTEYENAYNESGQLIYQISKYYEVSGLNNQERHDFEYDDKGRLCLDLYSFWNGEGRTKNQKIEYNYEACDTYNVGVYQKTSTVYGGKWCCTSELGYLKLDKGYKYFDYCGYDYDWSTGDLTDCYIWEYTYDAKGNQIGYKQASGVTEDGMPQVQQEAEYVYIFSDRGNNRITSDQSEWDYNQNKLVEKRKSTTEKTEEGVTILTIQTSYDGTEWTTESCYELEYDEDGVLISSAQLGNNEGTFTRNGAMKYARKYDSNGNTLLDAKYSGDENGDWICMYKGEYEYDEFGNRTLDKYERIEGWYDKHEYQYVFFYNEYGSYNGYKTVNYTYYWSNDAWVGNGNAYTREYDANGKMTQEITFTWDSEKGDWKYNTKGLYAYDENGNRTLEEQYTWDSSKGGNGDWVASRKSEWYLNEYGWNSDKARYEVVNGEFVCTYIVEVEHGLEISKKEYQIINEENGEKVTTRDEEYRLFYNAETESYERMETKYYRWNWNGEKLVSNWEAREKEYDDFGNITKETSFRWDSENDEWYIQNQSSYTFDMNVLTADIAMKEGQYNWKYKLLSKSSHNRNWDGLSYNDSRTDYYYSVFGYYYYVDGESHEIIPDGDELVGEDLTLIDKQTYSANTDFTVGNLTYKRTFVDSEWNALYVPFNIPVETLDEEGLQAAEILTTHIYDDDQDGTVDRTTIEVVPVISGELEANVPYVVRAKELEGEKEVEINLSNILVHESENNSVDCSSTKQLFTFTGSYEPITGETLFTDGLYYIGINAETQNVAIVQAGSAETPSLPAQRWTLAVTDRFGNKVVSNVRAIDIIMDEDATGIEAIGAGAESATDVYNVAGVKVATMTAGQSIKNLALPAGVYVNKGHKFIIK